MQISLSRGYFTGSHFTFDSQLSVACTQVSNISNWDCEHFIPLLFFVIANAGEFVCCLGRCFPRPVEWLSITMHRFVKSFITYIFVMKLTDVMIVICCHMLSYVVVFLFVSFFPGGFLSVFTVSMLTVMPWPCATPRPTCGDDRSPRGRIPSCLAGPGEPGRASSSWARCRFHTEKFTNFTGRARDFSRLGATGLLFQHVPTGSSTFPLDPRWSPCTCSRARSMVWSWWHRGHPQRCPVKFPVWPGIFDYSDLFGLFYLFFYKSLCQKSFTIFASCGLLALKSTRLESLR